jgi:betaine-aldehyde dehydrogenase
VFGGDVIVRREPVGVVAAIVPWNVPQGLIMPKLAPALLAGCSVVVKPAPETPLDSLFMAQILEEAGIPNGVVSVVPADRQVGEHLVRHPGVDKVAFTGSTAAGRRIAAICGEHLKRVSLELGGKSAAIILEDADIPVTIAGLKVASLMNNGEVCAAQTRILAPRTIYDQVVDGLATMVDGLQVGDPFDPTTDIGPLVSQRQQQRVQKYIALGQEEGAKLIVGGVGSPHRMERGWYVRPTLFANADNSMRIAREEIFGPVLVVVPFDDEAEAVRIANDSEYGLAGSVWTRNIDHGMEIARHIRAGSLGINQYSADFAAPFGGFKASGIGREWGREGLESYVEFKQVLAGQGLALAQ